MSKPSEPSVTISVCNAQALLNHTPHAFLLAFQILVRREPKDVHFRGVGVKKGEAFLNDLMGHPDFNDASEILEHWNLATFREENDIHLGSLTNDHLFKANW